MSVANSSVQGAATNASRPAANAAADNDSQATCTPSKGFSPNAKTQDSSAGVSSGTTEAASSPIQSLANANVSATKTDGNSVTPNENKSKVRTLNSQLTTIYTILHQIIILLVLHPTRSN